MHDETELIRLARLGERKAFRELYERHVDPLYRFLRKFSSDAHELEEWVQRAFIKAFRGIGSFDGRSKFSSWLFRIGINEMKTDRRRISNTEELADEIPDSPSSEADAEFVWESTMSVLLEELSENKRMVFILFEVEGYSHAEIAAMLNINEGTSRSILTRARQHLKRQWQAEKL
jgi:RNA polymerase sigma-70 factor (ECF subfamily)